MLRFLKLPLRQEEQMSNMTENILGEACLYWLDGKQWDGRPPTYSGTDVP